MADREKMISSKLNLKLVILSLVSLVGIVIAALLYLPIMIIRCAVIVLAKVFRKDLDSLIAGGSCMLASVDDVYGKPKANIVLTIIVEDGFSVEKFKSLVNSVINLKDEDGTEKFKEMKQHYKGWLGFLFFQWDENFDINDHINIYNFNGQSEYLCSQNDLCQIISEVQSRSWKESQSPWEFWIIPKYQENASNSEVQNKGKTQKSVIILRNHHGLADGYALINFTRYLCSSAYPTVIPQFTKRTISLTETILGIFTFPFRAVYQVIHEFSNTRDDNQLHSPTKKTTGVRHVAISDRIPISDIKSVMKSNAVSFQSVVNAAVSGAIRRHLNCRGLNSADIPKYMHGVMPIPFPGHTLKLTNHFSFNTNKFPVGESSALERLRLSDFHHKMFMKSTLPTVHFYLTQFLGSLFCDMTKLLTDHVASTTALFTNLAGPSDAVKFSGTLLNVEDIMFAADAVNSHTGLSFSFLSYNGYVRLVVLVDVSIIPELSDVKKIPVFVKEEIEVMKAVSN